MSTIVLNSKNYVFSGYDRNGVSVFKETSTGITGGFSYLTNRVSDARVEGTTRIRWDLTMPILATEDSACGCEGKVLRVYRYQDGDIKIPEGSQPAERADFLARVRDLTASAPYGLSVSSLTQAT